MGGGWPSQGTYLSGNAMAAKSRSEGLFRQVADLVREKSADPPTGKALLGDSLEGMLVALDPHSNYYSPDVFKDLMEDQKGKFSGLGILVTKPGPNSPLLVITPIPDTPASKAGIRAGDVILEVDGKPTDKMSSREAVRRLKGPKGTNVTIKLGRGSAEPAILTLTRAPIPKHTVPYAFMLKNGEAYLKINTFGQTTAAEVKRHLSDLDSKGMTSLVLDLRDNPGGSFPAAIDVASLFLKKGQEVVSIRGRYAGIVRRYNVSRDGKYANVPMAVLLNLGSASASEIVAGALQDHDRALVVGQRSWGKGLVQTLTPLENQGAVAITTARYYTPSGRLIQRDYSKSYDAYYFPEEQPERVKEETKTEEKQEEKFTDAGRPVFGGGGIAPDIKVEAGKIPPLALKLERRRAYLNFVAHKVETGQMDAKTAESPELVAEFKAYIEKQGDAFTPEEWKASQTYTRCALAREALTMLEGQAAGFKAMIPLDNQLLKAESLLLQPGSDKKRAA